MMQDSSKFFENCSCSFFPCHKGLDDGEFNCLFCYCPLYEKIPCPGNPSFIKKDDGRIIKRCTDCTFPHRPENYERIMNLLRTKKTPFDFTEEFHHGGETFISGKLLDFSVNTNPLGLPESVKIAIKNSLDLCEKYPDQNCTLLRKKLWETHITSFGMTDDAFGPENIVFGNGASELISLVVQAIMPKKALLLAPTFSGYERALKICGCQIQYHLLREEKDFALDDEIFEPVEKFSPDMIFLCNPNNPTGRMVNPELLEKLTEICETKGIFLVVDECFIDFTERSSESALRFAEKSSHLVVLNAFTKIYATAGLRLGYLVTSNSALIKKLNFLKPEWNVSTIAQIAGEVALGEKDYIEKTRVLIKNESDYLQSELKALGFMVFPSEANFILFKIPDLRACNLCAPDFETELQKNGVVLRNCANFKGLSEKYWRVAVKSHEDNENLIDILRKIC